MDLPLLKYVIDAFPDIDLEEYAVIGAQHLLGTTFDLFTHLFQKGLKPRNVFLIGKAYSSSHQAVSEMRKAGVYVCRSSFKFLSYESFDKQYAENTKAFLEKVLPGTRLSKKIIFLDDGGYLIKIAHRFLLDFSNVVGVEQTTSGYDALKAFDLKFPLINVARCMVKLAYESPMIAASIATRIYDSLSTLGIGGNRSLIIGGGAIGRCVYDRIKKDFEAKIFDSNQILSMVSAQEYHYLLSKSDLIIGCTGRRIISPKNYHFLKKGVFLASASSSDREFDAVHLRRKVNAYSNPHKDIFVDKIHLINSGFPVNFNGYKHCVPPEQIQLTRALLICGIFQALRADRRVGGIYPLDTTLQKDILTKFMEINRKNEIPSLCLESTAK